MSIHDDLEITEECLSIYIMFLSTFLWWFHAIFKHVMNISYKYLENNSVVNKFIAFTGGWCASVIFIMHIHDIKKIGYKYLLSSRQFVLIFSETLLKLPFYHQIAACWGFDVIMPWCHSVILVDDRYMGYGPMFFTRPLTFNLVYHK